MRSFPKLIGAACAATMAVCSLAQAQTVDAAIALAADVSLSIDSEEFALQRRGYAAAVTDRRFLEAVQASQNGSVALCFLEWAGEAQQTLVAKWTVIRDGEGAAVFAKILRDAPRSFAGRTAIGAGVDFAVAQLDSSGFTTKRPIIDVSGDGTGNSGRPVTDARDAAVAKGISINGLAIINEKTAGRPGSYLYLHTHPPGGLPNYYKNNVIGGPGAFVLQIVNFDTFAEAMANKLITEVSGAPRRLKNAAAH